MPSGLEDRYQQLLQCSDCGRVGCEAKDVQMLGVGTGKGCEYARGRQWHEN